MAKYNNKTIGVRADSKEWDNAIENCDIAEMQRLTKEGIQPSKSQLLSVKNTPGLYRHVYSGFTGNTLAKEITDEDRKKADAKLNGANNGDSKTPQKAYKMNPIKVHTKYISEMPRYREASRNWYNRTRVF